MNNKIAVAVSGGIDSLVAAFLIKRQGFDVFGLHFVTGFEDNPSIEEAQGHYTVFPGDARQETAGIRSISDQLGIPVHVIDIRKEFRVWVSDYFYRAYLSGLTPNPCIACNAKIKFGLMIEKASFFGAGHLATGHYARAEMSGYGLPMLFSSTDTAKDQSYFLSLVRKEAFAKAIFPLSGLTKNEVRQIASDNVLVPPFLKESQDICFIKSSYGDFMETHPGFSARPGEIVSPDGKKIGTHNGLHLFTIGQRRGINCPAKEPYYVLDLDIENNRLVVGFKKELYKKKMLVDSMNWFRELKTTDQRLSVKIRYAHKAAEADVRIIDKDSCEVVFDEPQLSITPGQAAVLYDRDEVIGGGFIRRS
ncbi:tRNA 2-thiouridine(34) synthase MnmA [Desulforegula conservatrix]|uniref:tRNA 2-thiouridine(34) synthase MnmA n=1 Tax=Desulforegula conservatrix TaxID=153026 RepID=UPI0003FBAB4A|nr:tRNA 2-thiouridine(34) synthase MnmA [Desulforegula conservatrix]